MTQKEEEDDRTGEEGDDQAPDREHVEHAYGT